MLASRPNSPADQALPANTALRALELLAQWRRIAGAHLPLTGIGCIACGAGGNGVSVQDFEIPLLDFLHGRHGSNPALRPFFQAADHVPGSGGQMMPLLAALARAPEPVAGAAALLDDLGRSIDSFARVHR